MFPGWDHTSVATKRPKGRGVVVQSPGARARGAAAVERLRRGRRPPRGAQRRDAVHPGQTPADSRGGGLAM